MKKKMDVRAFTSSLRGESVFFPLREGKPSPEHAGEPLESGATSEERLFQETRLPENKETSFLVNKKAGKQVFQKTRKRTAYPKVTYQLNPIVTDILEDAKHTIRRQYNIKVSLADIVEEAIQHICQDLQKNKETSFLVNKFSSNQENK
jgi:hypothetical protein